MSKIIFANRYFHPDHSATSQILSDLAFDLARTGRNVHVVTSRQRYDDPAAKLARRESIAGVEVHRVWTTRFGRGGLAGRAIDYLSFYLSATLRLAVLARSGDVVVAKTDPPLLSVPAGAATRLRGARLVNWHQDIYPELAIALRRGRAGNGLLRFLGRLRNRSLRRAAANVAVGEAMADRLARLAQRPIDVIPNWTDEAALRTAPDQSEALRAAWGLSGTYVVAYAGNLGRAHDIDTVLGAAEALTGDKHVRFLFIGGGHRLREVEARARAAGLRNIVTVPYQPREQLAEALSVGDVHWLSLRPELEGLVLPSKFYGMAAISRPMIVVGSPASELARLVQAEGCGFAVTVGRPDEFVGAINALRTDPAIGRLMAARGRALVEGRLSRRAALAKWAELLDRVGGSMPRPE